MSTTLADMTAALQTLLMDHFHASAPTAEGQSFLAFELGSPIPDETFHLPADNPDYSPAVALEYMSHQANMAPRLQDGVLFETSNRIDNLYEILLKGSTALEGGSLELLGMVKNSAQASFDNTLGSSLTGALERFHPVHADPINWYDQRESGNWTSLSLNQQDEPPAPPPRSPGSGPGPGRDSPRSPFLLMWRPAPRELQPILAAPVTKAGIRAFSRDAEAAAVEPRLSVAAPVARHFRARGTGAAFSARTTLTRDRPAVAAMATSADPTSRSSTLLTASRFGARLGGLVAAAPAATAPAVTSDGFSIALDVCLVHLRRPWFSDGLMNLGSWFVPSLARGSFSGGIVPDSQTPLNVLPIACVCIRNVSITARWNDADRAQVETSSHLGAFSLLGRSFDTNTATLRVPGMQSIAWICQPLPVLPPNDPP